MYDHKQYLIALSGKMGSGKDTVADIIRVLTAENAVASQFGSNVTHRATDAEIAFSLKLQQEGHPITLTIPSPFQVRRFAQKVKEIATLLTGIPIEKFEDQEFKKSFLGPEWDTVTISYSSQRSLESTYGGIHRAQEAGWIQCGYEEFDFTTHTRMTVRELLQKIGTDCMRDRLHTNVWVNSLFADWKLETSPNSNPPGSKSTVGLDVITQWPVQKWLITDMRFPNELAAVKRYKGLTIRIIRPGHDSGSTHESETALDGSESLFDEVLVNDGTLEELVAKVRAILIKYKLL